MERKRILKCRVCLEDFKDEQMFDLFKEKKIAGVHNSSMKLFERVEYCCGVKIRECSEMPSKICFKCYNVTRMWYNFRQMCVNSQVYLESLCSDDGDDGEYLKYLFDDLQTFRSRASHQNSDFYVSAEQTASEREYTSDYDCHDERELTIAEDSHGEIEYVENSVKDRKKDVADVKDDGIPTSTDTGAKKPKCSQKKGRNFTKRKRRRQASPSTYMCSVCGNVYAKKASFTYHMSLHSDVKPHECELCGKSFRQTCELKNHIRRHTGERPYKCAYCDRCFIDRSEKHRHERVHTNTRPYVCNVCGKSFMYSAILKNHSKLHSGEKEFSCVVCQKAFTLQHQLKAHLQTITHKQREAQFCKTAYDLVYE